MESNTIFDKIGGRKFFMSLVCLGSGIAIELYGKNGLSTNMVALIGAIYATFTGTNAFITNKAMASSSETEVEAAAPSAPIDMSQINKAQEQMASAMSQVGTELARQQEQQQIIQNSLLQIQKFLASMVNR